MDCQVFFDNFLSTNEFFNTRKRRCFDTAAVDVTYQINAKLDLPLFLTEYIASSALPIRYSTRVL